MVRSEILADLGKPQAAIAPKYFYDLLGSRLFTAITALDEYYPTRTEAAIFATHAVAMATAFHTRDIALVDLGAADCEKGARLFNALTPAQYVAIDISVDFLRAALEALHERYPNIEMIGVGADFSRKLVLPPEVQTARRLFFYPGSSLGNFTPTDAVGFLAQIRAHCGVDGGLLIGIDLVKDHATLAAAYDDALGVTAAFNLNVLRHLNRIAGTDFVVSDWRHVGLFNAIESRIEMHLEAKRTVTLHWAQVERRFAAGERIHTENSYKYTTETFTALLAKAGLSVVQHWTDSAGWFGVFLARPAT